ncbi:hypothetical protein U9M48_038583 [Paspalum notatum var. saurae]|uniref:Uncharacterized protein n=1 Tax=Paspalum notatum var. saurae TaxID=547442 RepID=A0AAQ3UJK6_PASNO
MALEVLTKAVPAERMGTIANKATAKLAWDSIKLINVGVERVHKAKASTLRCEFDSLKFKDGETVDDFGIRINRSRCSAAGSGRRRLSASFSRHYHHGLNRSPLLLKLCWILKMSRWRS